MRKLPRTLWTNIVNLSGLYSPEPIKLTAQKGWDKRLHHWDKTRDVDFKQMGLFERGAVIQFTSKSKKEVELWTMGVKAVMDLLKRWSA
ncbi:MAG TPA: hypothetical protein ENI27_06795 [bacterium]|nr:hypothetical protein [bacterium]